VSTADVLDRNVRVTITTSQVPSIFKQAMGCGHPFDPMFVMDEIERARAVIIDWVDTDPDGPDQPIEEAMADELADDVKTSFLKGWRAENEIMAAEADFDGLETELIAPTFSDYDIPRFPRLAKLCFWRRWRR
jgi:hypothetical protein